ncbi:GDP-fucose protein O-fucosyltransferase 1-like [Glandiceps talaboti]
MVLISNSGLSAMFQLLLVFLFVLNDVVTADQSEVSIDPNGYIMFCPCMGRFGNQADHYLGAIGFAKGLDRTLVLPPWVEYPPWPGRGSDQIAFDTYFQVEPLREYHRVITMEDFMTKLAPIIWPEGERLGFCYTFSRDPELENQCNMKSGNPFGPFWDHFNIDFDSYMQYGGLSYDTRIPGVREAWDKKFPASDYPVLAFSGAPASFPVNSHNKDLHQYLQWSDKVTNEANKFIENELPSGPFVGIHLRHGSDWKNACEHIQEKNVGSHLFASPQCLGYRNEHGTLTYDMCMPRIEQVLKKTRKAVKKMKAKGVFVATDDKPLITELTKSLKKFKVKVVERRPKEPHVDLAILAKSDLYIGNCISSFSSFATREREVLGKPTWFWGFEKYQQNDVKEEL